MMFASGIPLNRIPPLGREHSLRNRSEARAHIRCLLDPFPMGFPPRLLFKVGVPPGGGPPWLPPGGGGCQGGTLPPEGRPPLAILRPAESREFFWGPTLGLILGLSGCLSGSVWVC